MLDLVIDDVGDIGEPHLAIGVIRQPDEAVQRRPCSPLLEEARPSHLDRDPESQAPEPDDCAGIGSLNLLAAWILTQVIGDSVKVPEKMEGMPVGVRLIEGVAELYRV